MTAIDFPSSPSTNDSKTAQTRTWLYNSAQWDIKNCAPALVAAFARANTANTVAYSFNGYLSNTPNTWMDGPLNIAGNLAIVGDPTLAAQDTMIIRAAAGQTGNVLAVVDAGGNTLWRMLANGMQLAAHWPGHPKGDVEKRIARWMFTKPLTGNFATATQANNRTGLKFAGIPGKCIAFEVFGIAIANAGFAAARSSAGFNFGIQLSANVYQRGVHLLVPTSTDIASFAHWAPWSNNQSARDLVLANTFSPNSPQTNTAILLRAYGIVEFAANSVNSIGGPNVEVVFGTETLGSLLHANSFIKYMVL